MEHESQGFTTERATVAEFVKNPVQSERDSGMIPWHEQIGDPTLADGILDRLVHHAHRIEMRGDSMRKNRGKPNS